MKPIYSVVAIATVLLSIQMVSAQMFVKRRSKAHTVTTVQVQALLADSENNGRFVIVDVRDKVETDVSIIPGAITRDEFERTQQDHQRKAVIVYCTIGHRSGSYARELSQNGWNAWNYEGSILDWCKNRLPVETLSGQRTMRVHTYNSSYVLAAGYQPVY